MAKNNNYAPKSFPGEHLEGVPTDYAGAHSDHERVRNFRGKTDRFRGGKDLLNPYWRDENDHQLGQMELAPNSAVEQANMQNKADFDELTAIEAREAEIQNGNSLKRMRARKELAGLAARKLVIDPSGNMTEVHREFKENNLDLLMENAQAEAERRGISIKTEADTDAIRESIDIDTAHTIANVVNDIVDAGDVSKGGKLNLGPRPNTDKLVDKVAERVVTTEKLQEAQDALSAMLHDNWRNDLQSGYIANGEDPNTKRMRPSKDKTGEADAVWFAEQEANGVEFEIDDNGNKLVNTNVAYENLPPSWKQANIGAAKFVTELVADGINKGIPLNEVYIEAKSKDVHDQWMKDNAWEKDSRPHLFVEYSELTEEEKAKDRAQVKAALDVFQGEKSE